MKEIIKEILTVNQQGLLESPLLPRQTGLILGLDKIQAIIGPRRVGKTSSMILALKELKEQRGIPVNQLFYFNFEDERVQFSPQQLDLLLQGWQELYPESKLSDTWYFFDEVESAPGWECFLNRINETVTKRIFFTGSNSSVLHTKIKSVMRGRSIAIELLPLSFREYCNFSGTTTGLYGADKSRTLRAFYNYLEDGGYPETVNLPNQTTRIAFLQEYYNSMLLRDIVESNKLSNYTYLRSLYRMAAGTIGKLVSVRRLHNHLKAASYSVGMNSVYEAMDMAENAYLFKRISRFDFSDNKREKSEKKIYWLDNGLLNANTSFYAGNKGILLENLVFRELYRRYGTIYDNNIYYYTDASSECDFIVYAEGRQPLPVQVSWTLADPDTREREIKGLLRAAAYCHANEAWIFTVEEENDLTIDQVRIRIAPVWKWLLQDG